jgi:ABC-type transporter Mla MlaB component
MLRIMRAARAEGTPATLLLEGKVVGPWVDQLQRSLDEALDEVRAVVLDMGQVTYVDAPGLALLTGLKADRVRIINCSPFVAEQLGHVVPGAFPE